MHVKGAWPRASNGLELLCGDMNAITTGHRQHKSYTTASTGSYHCSHHYSCIREWRSLKPTWVNSARHLLRHIDANLSLLCVHEIGGLRFLRAPRLQGKLNKKVLPSILGRQKLVEWGISNKKSIPRAWEMQKKNKCPLESSFSKF